MTERAYFVLTQREVSGKPKTLQRQIGYFEANPADQMEISGTRTETNDMIAIPLSTRTLVDALMIQSPLEVRVAIEEVQKDGQITMSFGGLATHFSASSDSEDADHFVAFRIVKGTISVQRGEAEPQVRVENGTFECTLERFQGFTLDH